jgi:acetyl esterase/lipase
MRWRIGKSRTRGLTGVLLDRHNPAAALVVAVGAGLSMISAGCGSKSPSDSSGVPSSSAATKASYTESVTGPLAQKVSGSPPAISVGGKNAQEINDKIKSGALTLVKPLAKVPEGVEASMDFEYGKGGKTPLRLDLFKPKEIKRPVPGLIFVHGGGWSRGTRKNYDYYCEHFAKNGYVAATIEYRLSGEAPFPAAIQDVKCAIRWMRTNAAKLGVDPQKIGLAGGSAGGHLVLLAAYSNTDDPLLEGNGGNAGVSSRVQAVIDLYGLIELHGRRSRAGFKFVGRKTSDADPVVTFMGGKTSDEEPELYAKASPIAHLTKDAPPTLILHGTVDELVNVRQSDELAARLGELGVPYLYDRQDGWNHGMDDIAEVNVRCLWMMDQFLAQVLPLPTK